MSADSDEPVDCLFVGDDADVLASVRASAASSSADDATPSGASRLRIVHARTRGDAVAALEARAESTFGFVVVDVETLAERDDARRLAETVRASTFHRTSPIVFLTADRDDSVPEYRGRASDPYGVCVYPRTLAPARFREQLRPLVERAEFERHLARHTTLVDACEQENSRLQAMLDESLRFNDTFVAVVSHDLRNPLNAILMAVQMLQMGSLAENERRFVDTARTSGKRMAAMLDDLADLARARLESGIGVLREPSDLSVFARRAVAELRAAHPDRVIDIECTGTGVGEWDGARLEQLVGNLVGNALRHGDPEGNVHVWVDGTDRSFVRLRVHNRGQIAPDVMPTLFDAFQSGRRRRTRSGGLGLGLYICRQIAHAHGGEVNVASSAETGTTVQVELTRTMALEAARESEHAPGWH